MGIKLELLCIIQLNPSSICDVNDQVNLLIMMEIAKLFKICSHCDDDQDIVTMVPDCCPPSLSGHLSLGIDLYHHGLRHNLLLHSFILTDVLLVCFIDRLFVFQGKDGVLGGFELLQEGYRQRTN